MINYKDKYQKNKLNKKLKNYLLNTFKYPQRKILKFNKWLEKQLE